jgi:hypothetical protein
MKIQKIKFTDPSKLVHGPVKQKYHESKQKNHRAKSITNLSLILSEGVEPEAAFGVIEETEALVCLWD